MPPRPRGRTAAPPTVSWWSRADRGAGSVEYLGIVVVVVVVVGLVLAGAPGVASTVTAGIERAFCSVGGGTGCGAAAAPASADAGEGDGAAQQDGDAEPDASDDDRRDTARDARDSRRDDRDRDEPTKGPSPTSGTTGPAPGLGDGVPGETVTAPQAPPWAPVDAGAGEYDSEGAGAGDHATKFAAEAAANALAGTWPNASRNLLHFLGNSGEPLQQDVDKLLADVPALATTYATEQDRFGLSAVERAQADGVTGPVTYPLAGDWTGFYVTQELSSDWFYAMGGITYSVVGEVTVYPPTEPGGAWTYETSTALELRDQYNWDGGKSTQIGPFDVTDEQLAELHRAGLAQEFTATGRSAVTSRKGTA